jgi:hypothetical protein
MAQDSAMLFQFLTNSVTSEAKLTLLADKDLYQINGVRDGVVFLKSIVGKASFDTNAKVNMLRLKIANLKNTMRVEHNGNVRDFNLYVNSIKEQLTGRGQPASELITHLFDAYLGSVPN